MKTFADTSLARVGPLVALAVLVSSCILLEPFADPDGNQAAGGASGSTASANASPSSATNSAAAMVSAASAGPGAGGCNGAGGGGGGGGCVGSSCKPVPLFAAPNVLAAAASQTQIVVAYAEGGTCGSGSLVTLVTKDGVTKTPFVSCTTGKIDQIATDGTAAFFSSSNVHSSIQVESAGSGPLTFSPEIDAQAIAVMETSLVFATPTPTSMIYSRMRNDPGTTPAPVMVATTNHVLGLASDNQRVFWRMANGSVAGTTTPLGAHPNHPVFSGKSEPVAAIAARSNELFAATKGRIIRFDTTTFDDGTMPTPHTFASAPSTDWSIVQVAVTTDLVAWLARDPNNHTTLFRDGPCGPVAVATNLDLQLDFLEVDGQAYFYVDLDGVKRLSR